MRAKPFFRFNAINAMNAGNALHFTQITSPPVIFCSSWAVSLKTA
jgi:hypothetical protein